jgi:hypothetical protein
VFVSVDFKGVTAPPAHEITLDQGRQFEGKNSWPEMPSRKPKAAARLPQSTILPEINPNREQDEIQGKSPSGPV